MSRKAVVVSVMQLDDGMFLVESSNVDKDSVEYKSRAEVAPTAEVVITIVKRIIQNAGWFGEMVN